MSTLRIEHHVANYAGWKKAFDDDPIERARSGVLRYSMLRGIDNPNEVMIDLDFASKEAARSPSAAMRQVWGQVQGTFIFGLRAQIVETVETKEY